MALLSQDMAFKITAGERKREAADTLPSEPPGKPEGSYTYRIYNSLLANSGTLKEPVTLANNRPPLNLALFKRNLMGRGNWQGYSPWGSNRAGHN